MHFEIANDKQSWSKHSFWILDYRSREQRLGVFRSKRSDVKDFTRDRLAVARKTCVNRSPLSQALEILRKDAEIDPNRAQIGTRENRLIIPHYLTNGDLFFYDCSGDFRDHLIIPE